MTKQRPQPRYEFKIWQDGIVVVSGEGAGYEGVSTEALHYASQYIGDSNNLKLTIGLKKVRRKP